MHSIASLLVAAAAAVVLALGCLHLVYTYRGRRFHPRDAALEARMKEVAPRISSETTMWRAGLGFHASHSLGAILFGMVYLDLALEPGAILFRSPFLMALGLACLLGWLAIAKACWFKVPYRGIVLATALYTAGLVVH